jgi:hypothetical protein
MLTTEYFRSFPYRLFTFKKLELNRSQDIVVHHRCGFCPLDRKELMDVKIPAWLRWDGCLSANPSLTCMIGFRVAHQVEVG